MRGREGGREGGKEEGREEAKEEVKKQRKEGRCKGGSQRLTEEFFFFRKLIFLWTSCKVLWQFKSTFSMILVFII